MRLLSDRVKKRGESILKIEYLLVVWVQLRLRDNLDNAIASEPMRVNVGEIFKDGVI